MLSRNLNSYVAQSCRKFMQTFALSQHLRCKRWGRKEKGWMRNGHNFLSACNCVNYQRTASEIHSQKPYYWTRSTFHQTTDPTWTQYKDKTVWTFGRQHISFTNKWRNSVLSFLLKIFTCQQIDGNNWLCLSINQSTNVRFQFPIRFD